MILEKRLCNIRQGAVVISSVVIPLWYKVKSVLWGTVVSLLDTAAVQHYFFAFDFKILKTLMLILKTFCSNLCSCKYLKTNGKLHCLRQLLWETIKQLNYQKNRDRYILTEWKSSASLEVTLNPHGCSAIKSMSLLSFHSLHDKLRRSGIDFKKYKNKIASFSAQLNSELRQKWK